MSTHGIPRDASPPEDISGREATRGPAAAREPDRPRSGKGSPSPYRAAPADTGAAVPPVPFLSHRTVFVTEPGGGERVVITLSGELDMVSGAMVTEVVEMCLRSRPTGVRVDISDLTLMDCGGLGQLHRAARAARLAGAGFTLTGSPQPMVGRVLQLTGTPLGALPAPREDTPSRPAAAPGRWARLLRLSVLTASATTILLAVAESA